METTAMILNDLINSETTLQSPLHPAGVGVQAALPLHIQVAFPQNSTSMSSLLLPLFFVYPAFLSSPLLLFSDLPRLLQQDRRGRFGIEVSLLRLLASVSLSLVLWAVLPGGRKRE